jgi:pimeloyl-ACP methyl ester carboxylesterase
MTPPKAANNLQQAIPHSQTVFIQGSGHMMMIEYPDQTLDVLRDFLQTTIPLGQDYEGE